MFRTDNETSSDSLPTPEAVGPHPNGYFVEGSVPSADWMNALTEEICYVITQNAGVLSKTDRTQLLVAIQAMVETGPVRSGISAVVDDPTPVQGGDLVVNGFGFVTSSNRDFVITPNGTGVIEFNANSTLVHTDLAHAGDTDNKLTFDTNTQEFKTGGTTRIKYDSSGLTIGTGVAVNKILDEDNFASDDDTALFTQQSLKAFVDAEIIARYPGHPFSGPSKLGSYLSPSSTLYGWSYLKANSNAAEGIAPRALTIRGLVCYNVVVPGLTSLDADATFTLYKNGSPTALTVTVTGSGYSNSNSDLVHSVSFAAGDKMLMVVTAGSGSVDSAPHYSMLIR